MGFNVGMPLLKLDNNDHFGETDKHAGNAEAVVKEALEERQSSDPDLDSEKTKDNVYHGERSGEKLLAMWNKQADEYRVIDKNGKERKLRSDAGIGFAGICKPDKEYMDTLTPEEQKKFLQDCEDVLRKIFAIRGMVIDTVVWHLDEGAPHLHYFGHDPEYKLGKKLGLPLYKALNDTQFPKMMREKGWDVNSLKGYDLEAAQQMTEDELKKYKQDHIHAKKEHGKNAKKFKADKDRAKEQALQERLSNARNELSEVNGDINNLKTDKEALEGKIEALKGDKRTLEEEEEKIISKIETDAKAKIDAIEVPEEPKDTFGKPEFHAVDSMLTALDSASKKDPVGEDKAGNSLIEVKFKITKDFLGDWINLLTRLKDLMNIYKAKEKAVQKITETKASVREKLNIKQMIVKNQEKMKDINIPSDPSKSKKHEQSR